MSNKYIIGILIFVCFILSCNNERPSGKEVEDFLNHINNVSRPEPKGNRNEFYSLLSKQFILNFENEINMAKELDSIELRNLPSMSMLRVLSLKNSFGDRLYKDETKILLLKYPFGEQHIVQSPYQQ